MDSYRGGDGSGIESKENGVRIAEQLSENEVFDVLSNERRRYAFEYLKRKENDSISLRELVDHIAAEECDKPIDQLTAAERNRVSTALHQFHLPKMDDCGFVEYDNRRGTVELSDEATELEIHFDVMSDQNVPWCLYYLGLGGLDAVVLLGVLLDAPPFAFLPSTAWLVFVVASLIVVAAVHAYYSREAWIGRESANRSGA